MINGGVSYLVLAGLLSWGVYLIKNLTKELKQLDTTIHDLERKLDIRAVTQNESNRYTKENITSIRSNVKETLHEIQQEVNKVRTLIRSLAKEWDIRIAKQKKSACAKEECPNRQKLSDEAENEII